MIDDRDTCEWVDVSSGTGSPGLSRTNPESRKTVVVVVVMQGSRFVDTQCKITAVELT